MALRRYHFIRHDAEREAKRLLQRGYGDITSYEVVDELLELLQEADANAVFVQTDGKEIAPDKVRRMREELGFNFCC